MQEKKCFYLSESVLQLIFETTVVPLQEVKVSEAASMTMWCIYEMEDFCVELHKLLVNWLPLQSTFTAEEPLLHTARQNLTKGGQRPINHLG